MLTPLHVSFVIFDVCSPFMSLLIVYMCMQDGDQVREHLKITILAGDKVVPSFNHIIF